MQVDCISNKCFAPELNQKKKKKKKKKTSKIIIIITLSGVMLQ